jgi:hypothetical protein
MIEPLTKIEPLINDLKKLGIGYYLTSDEYKRYLIKVGIDVEWKNHYKSVKKNRGYYSLGMDHDYHDSIGTMIKFLNYYYEYQKESLYNYLYDLIVELKKWSDKEFEGSDLNNLILDLEIIEFPNELLSEIKHQKSFSVPKSEIPNEIRNSKKLDESIQKLNTSINNKEYNLTLTFSYSILEGLFKAFINKNIPEKTNVDKLNPQAKIVKKFIINQLKFKEEKFPLGTLNLITTITYAISEARNSHSESHFDNDSEKWLAEFSRDCVNTIGRLILNFI